MTSGDLMTLHMPYDNASTTITFYSSSVTQRIIALSTVFCFSCGSLDWPSPFQISYQDTIWHVGLFKITTFSLRYPSPGLRPLSLRGHDPSPDLRPLPGQDALSHFH